MTEPISSNDMFKYYKVSKSTHILHNDHIIYILGGVTFYLLLHHIGVNYCIISVAVYYISMLTNVL